MRITEPKRGRLRVAHVTLGLDVGGQEKLLVEFARCADRRRFDLHFVSLGGRGVLADDLEAWGWPVEALGEPSGFRPGLAPRLAWLFRERRIDVVHTHDERPHIYGAFAARLAGVRRLVHTRHHGMAFRLTPRQAGLVRLAARLTDRFVCVSADSARQAVRQGVSPRTVRVLWNGIDLTRFEPPRPSRGTGPVITRGAAQPRKGYRYALESGGAGRGRGRRVSPGNRRRRAVHGGPAADGGRTWAGRIAWPSTARSATCRRCWRGPGCSCCRREPRACR